MWLKQAFTFTFWVWQDLRQITFFLVNILVSTIERNMEDWFEVQVEYDGPVGKPQGHWSSNAFTCPPLAPPLDTLLLRTLSSSPSCSGWMWSLEKVQRKSPDYISI